MSTVLFTVAAGRADTRLLDQLTGMEMISSSAVSASFIKELIRESAAAAKIILLDCCYSGAFLSGDVIKARPTVDDVGHDLAAGEGICVLTATTAVQVAEDGSVDRSAPLSVFTSAVVNGIANGHADDGTGVITTHSLWSYVSAEVRGRTSRQTPSHYGVLLEEVQIARTRRRLPTAIDGGARVVLGGLLGSLELTQDYGLRAENWWGTGRLTVPIGQQRRPDGGEGETVWLDFAGADRNLLIVGRVGSGKSTLLRTLVGALALTHTPDEVRIFALESSNRVGSLRALPHIARVVGDDEPDQVRLLLQEIIEEIRARKRLYREQSIDSPASLRSARSTLSHHPVPDLFLLLDRWGDFAGLLPDIDVTLKQIAATGPEYAVHVVATVQDWREVPDWLAVLTVSHIELRLYRPEDSRVDRDRAMRLPDGPGWALVGQRPFRVALPDIRDIPGDEAVLPEMTDGAADLVSRMSRVHRGDRLDRAYPPGGGGQGDNDFAALYGIGNPADLDLPRRWKPKRGPDRLAIPIGIDSSGAPVRLDVKEAAENGMGPHGMVVGVPGSGLSELLRAIVLGLAAEHSAEQVNFLLVDYKGSETFGGFAGLPHVGGYIGNVVADLSLVQRLESALSGELARRQELLRRAGNFSNIAGYEQARTAGAPLEPMPSLVVVINEVSELLSEIPDFAVPLVAIGRLGRSLGIHLLLASRRLDEKVLRGLDSHMSYRIGLKTYSVSESRALLGVPDAYTLPSTPGIGYLRFGELIQFRAAYTSRAMLADHLSGVVDVADRPLWESIVDVMRGVDGRTHQIWLPPLDESPTVGTLIPGLARPWLDTPRPMPSLRSVAVGIVDMPQWHRRDPLVLDLSGSNGNVAVVGGPQSGKSTALRTLILALAAVHTPDQVQFYCLDFGGGTLDGLRGLPHVGSVAGRIDEARVRRTVAELGALIQRREQLFRQLEIESMDQFRQRKARLVDLSPEQIAADLLSSDRFGDAFLVIDGYEIVRSEFDALEPIIAGIAMQGLAVGVHVILSAGRWAALRPALRDMLGTSIELRLGDPSDSALGRTMAAAIPYGRPGRGLTSAGEHVLLALPTLDTRGDPAALAEGITSAIDRLVANAGDLRAPEVRLLPEQLTREQLLRTVEGGSAQEDQDVLRLRFPVGLNESELAPVYIDFVASPHFLVIGDTESGKTNLLRLLAHAICDANSPHRAQIVLVDLRRTLLEEIPSGHLVGYITSSQNLAESLKGLVAVLEKRMPPADVTVQQLRDRSWWTGPELYVIIDDYDLLAASGGSHLSLLLEFLPQSRDLGFHLILARRSGGVSRAMYDPVIALMKDLSSAGLIMSGSRDEGVLLGTTRPTPLPPGRGVLVSREGQELIQTARLPPA